MSVKAHCAALCGPIARASAAVVLALSAGLLAAPGAAVTVDEIDARLAEVEKSHADEASKQLLLQTYQAAKSFLEAETASKATIAKYAKSLAEAPATLKTLETELTPLTRRQGLPQLTPAEKRLSPEELERLLEEAVTQQAALESKLKNYELRERGFSTRPAEIVQDKNRVTARLSELELGMAETAERDMAEIARARQTAAEAELLAKQAELEMLNQEQLSHPIRAEINTARRKVATLALALASARVSEIEQVLLERRQDEIRSVQENAAQALRDASGAHPVIQKLARENAKLSSELSSVIEGQAKAVNGRAEFAERRQRLNADFELARQRLQVAGTSSSLGRILVDQRRQLPKPSALQRQAKQNATEVEGVSLRRIDLDEWLRLFEDGQREARVLLANADLPPDAPAYAETEKRAQALLHDQRRLLENLDTNYASYLRSLDAADFELQQLIISAESYTAYLDERLLWLPNAPALSVQFLRDLGVAAQWFLQPANWQSIAHDLRLGVASGWPRVLGLVAVLVVAARARPRLNQMLARLAGELKHPATNQFRSTLYGLLITTALALPWPMALWAVAELLRAGVEAAEFSLALSQVIRRAAGLTFAALWLRALLADDGVALAHFQWPESFVKPFRAAWLKFAHVFIPTYAAAATFEWYDHPAFEYGLRRLFLLLAMLSAAAFCYWLLRNGGLLHRELALRQPRALLSRYRPVWAGGAVLAPVLLMLLSALGFHYAALELSHYYVLTVLLVLLAFVLQSVAIRWLLVAEQRLARKRALEQFAKTMAASTTAMDGGGDPGEDLHVDFATINAQTRMILRNITGWSVAFGLYWVWKDVLPALTLFENITLWEIQFKDAAGAAHTQPITIASVALAIIISGITVIASRNIPGVLEIALLQRLHHGSRYAITTLVQYVIVALGVSLALSSLGVRWSQIQWLVAALGVGLGFGLQEIFANFISGLVLLFERPIRVGDVVTMGELTGRVSRIQIRATTIRDFDNKEIVVPNKNFITERFINWTLTDQVTRIVISVGIAYGSDITKALQILLDIANAHAKVLRDPAPQALFTGFGDSALALELQVYAQELGHRVDVRHDINLEIHRSFAREGIEIPFPQREVRLRKVTPAAPPAGAPEPGPAPD